MDWVSERTAETNRDHGLTKRQILKYSAAGLPAVLAGCGGQSGSTDSTPTESSPTPTPTRTTAETQTQTPTETTATPALEPVAREFLTLLSDEDYSAAADRLSPAGERALEELTVGLFGEGPISPPSAALQRIWLGLTAQHRGFEEVRELSVDDDAQAVTATLRCSEAGQQVRLTVADDEQIRRLEFLSEYSSPEYADSDAYREQSLNFESGDETFGGTLTIPTDRATAPCVVLVQGAQIFDRDATTGPNKIFADIARGLATEGVATYRYDRRRPNEVDGKLTPTNYIVDDVVAAVDRIAEIDAVQSDALFVGGHSLGGRFTPKIAATHGGLAGMVILDTIGYGYLETQLKFARWVLSADFTTERERELARQRRDRIQTIQDEGLPEGDRVLGVSRSWVKANLEYDRIATADAAGVPTFVLHGGQFFIDKRPSLERWESGIDTSGSRFSYHPELNHYLQPVGPPSQRAEFTLFHDNLSGAVVEEIGDWVANL